MGQKEIKEVVFQGLQRKYFNLEDRKSHQKMEPISGQGETQKVPPAQGQEERTKIAFARVYKTNSSNFSKDFLLRLVYLVDGKVNYIHSDNGAEFEGSFSEACEDLNLSQIYSRPHTPKDNPALERFNWTIQDEWLSMSEIGLDSIDDANRDLTSWLIEYNNLRPHETLDQLTPLEYAQEHYFKVSPMWSASTPH